jgi:hypothetical protein
MAGLKTFLGRLSPLLGVTPAALYERQRVLVDIGLIKPKAGRGPGSGVAFTAENLAALVISILATDSLSEIDQRVVNLCNAPPASPVKKGQDEKFKKVLQREHDRIWAEFGKPTFLTEVARVLSGEPRLLVGVDKGCTGIRVTRMWRGQITPGIASDATTFYPPHWKKDAENALPVSHTAEIEEAALGRLVTFIAHNKAALEAA